MNRVRHFSRISGLTVALGIGAWLASVPWTAAADPSSDASNWAIDIFGLSFHEGSAIAIAGPLGFAYASGADSTANAGFSAPEQGQLGLFDYAVAIGAGSTALDAGTFSAATASDGGLATSGESTSDSFDSASASGAGSSATAANGSGDFANADGAGSTAEAGAGNDDAASVFGTDSTARATFGNSNIADVTGNNSTALAGGAGIGPNNNDFAAVNGDNLTANATGADNLHVVEPSSGADAAASTTPSDDLGLTALLHDLFGWL